MGHTVSEDQKTKLAGVESDVENRASARWVLSFGLPDSANQSVRYGVKISWVLGIIATCSSYYRYLEFNHLVADNEGLIS